jgi:hypothetical protein
VQVAEEIGTEVKSQKDFLEELVHHFLDNLYYSIHKKIHVTRVACFVIPAQWIYYQNFNSLDVEFSQ